MENIQIYVYTNFEGRRKALAVNWDRIEDNRYFCILRDLETSEQCGNAYKTKEEITDFLTHYNIEI